jgi:hypothetical protein
MTTQHVQEPRGKLFAALVKAQIEAKAVCLDAKNDHQKYRYASAESIIEEARSALTLAGLCFFVDSVALDCSTPTPIARVTMTLAHESGETLAVAREWPAIEQKGRPLDKALAGALTSGLGYALRDLLLLPRDDEFARNDRMDTRDDRDHAPKQKSAPSERGAEPASRMSDEQPYVEQPKASTGLDAILAAVMLSAVSDAEIEAGASSEEQASSVRFIRDAHELRRGALAAGPDLDGAFGKLGKEVKRALSEKAAAWTIERVREAWTMAKAERAERTAA